ncbi:MAG: hypothetical protein AMS22_01395 [Thiotrichales bacterium SG8_50]|nr:MAG: hypothetical protein AMS22_01395 [Thiotrichales bacterium SG8_50]
MLLVDRCEFEFLPRLEEIVHELPFKFVFFSGGDIQASLTQLVASFDFPMTLYTTRLDTDDLLASDYFARIGGVSIGLHEANERVVLSFPGGANYSVREDSFYYSSYPENPFLTMVERLHSAKELRGVYWKMHTELAVHVPHVRYLRSYHPMWASVIHDHNTSNESLTATNKVKLADGDFLKKKFGMAQNL